MVFKFTFCISPKLRKGEDFCITMHAQVKFYYCIPYFCLKWGGKFTFTQGGELTCIKFETAFFSNIEVGGGMCAIFIKRERKAKKM